MHRRAWLHDGGWIVALALVYLLTARLGLSLAFLHRSASPVWPPTGIALAALLLRGLRLWPGITLGALAANLLTSGNWPTSLGIAAGNTLEAVVGALLVGRYARGARALERPRDFFRYVGLGALVSPLLSASIGVTSLCLGGLAAWSSFAPIASTWWLGDAVGALVVGPPFLVFRGWRPRLGAGVSLRAAALSCLALLIAFLVFWGLVPGAGRTAPLAFLCIPFLVWAAFRFEQRGAALLGLALTAIAVSGTVRGYGPFVRQAQNTSLFILQAFLGTVMVMALALAAVVSERRRVGDALRARAQAQLSATEHNLTKAQALAHLGSWAWDIDSDRVQWSDELYRIFGLEPGPLTLSYDAYLSRVHPEDRDLVASAIDRARHTGEAFGFEDRIVRPDGSARWLHCLGEVVQRDGRAVAMHGTARDITEHKVMELERRRLELELLEVSHREQLRLGQDLHDDLGQLLTGVSFLAKTLEKKLAALALAEAGAMGEILSLLDLAMTKTRSLARGLPEAVVLGEGLPSALQDLAADTERRFNVACVFTGDHFDHHCGRHVTMHLYRIAQEATSNAVRHGKAARIAINLAAVYSGLTLAIQDDGVGFDPDGNTEGLGLRLMRYRAELLGGQLQVQSAPGETTVRCSISSL